MSDNQPAAPVSNVPAKLAFWFCLSPALVYILTSAVILTGVDADPYLSAAVILYPLSLLLAVAGIVLAIIGLVRAVKVKKGLSTAILALILGLPSVAVGSLAVLPMITGQIFAVDTASQLTREESVAMTEKFVADWAQMGYTITYDDANINATDADGQILATVPRDGLDMTDDEVATLISANTIG